MRNRESVVEDYLRKEVKKIGGLCRKTVSPGKSGVFDRLISLNYLAVHIEVKTVDGVISPFQKLERQRMRGIAHCRFVFGKEDVDKLIRQLKTFLVIGYFPTNEEETPRP